jgi:hypothetical protein
MQLQIVKREAQTMRLALFGRSGSGKTYSALLVAYGLCGDWQKIAVIDTEGRSASLYAHLGPFTTVQIGEPFHPSRFYEAIELCEESGKEVIIIDSLSPEWTGEGGVAEALDKPASEEMLHAHKCLLRLLNACTSHLICTMRGRLRLIHTVERTIKCWEAMETPIQQDGIEYSFTTVLKLDNRQRFHVVKDRTGLFMDKDPQKLEVDHGAFLSRWCRDVGDDVPEELQQKINDCKTQEELQLLLVRDDVDMAHIEAFTRRRLELDGFPPPLNAA